MRGQSYKLMILALTVAVWTVDCGHAKKAES